MRQSITHPARKPWFERRADAAAQSLDRRGCRTRAPTSGLNGLCSPGPPPEALLFFFANARGIGISQFCRLFTDYLVGLASALADTVSAHFVGFALGAAFRVSFATTSCSLGGDERGTRLHHLRSVCAWLCSRFSRLRSARPAD